MFSSDVWTDKDGGVSSDIGNMNDRSGSLISIPWSESREVVCRDALRPHRRHCHSARSIKVPIEISHKNQLFPQWPLHHGCHHIPNNCVGKQCQVTVIPVALSCDLLYRPAMVVIVVVIVAVFVNVIAVVIFRAGTPPNGLLSPCNPPNGENTKAWVWIANDDSDTNYRSHSWVIR